MGEHILVPFNASPLSQQALERALTKHPDADVTALYVIDPMLAVYEVEAEGLPAATSWSDRMDDRAAEICAEAEARAAEHDRGITTATETGRPSRAILEYAAEHEVDHIVMGSHGRSGVSRLILGSVAEQVMRQAPIPVTIVR